MITAVILSGGKGVRMKNVVPKQYLLLAGKPMIMHSIERIDSIPQINEIVIVCEKSFESSLELMMKQYNITTPIRFAPAGATRQESVFSGLQKVSNDLVLLHEAARPFVLKNDFLKLINEKEKNVTFGYEIPFTVVKGKEIILDTLSRDELKNIQLPQKFEVKTLLKAHEMAQKNNEKFTEDASMITTYKLADVKIINGNSYNIKITEPIDFLVGEIIYREIIRGRK